ncbi:MAG: hypothetical protein V9G12_19455 [Microthrixaceae bacterium]
MQALLSAPVIRKLLASGSACGNVSGGASGSAGSVVSLPTIVSVVRVVPVLGAVVAVTKVFSDASWSSTAIEGVAVVAAHHQTAGGGEAGQDHDDVQAEQHPLRPRAPRAVGSAAFVLRQHGQLGGHRSVQGTLVRSVRTFQGIWFPGA